MDEQVQLLAILYIMAIMLDLNAIEQVGQAAQQGDQAALMAIQLIQAALQGDQQAQQMISLIQLQALQMQAQSAKFGAKLNYIKYLRGKCPNGYEMQTFKKGGAICKKCVKKKEYGGYVPSNESGDVIKDFRKVREQKCGGKTKKKKINKAEYGSSTKSFLGGRPIKRTHTNVGDMNGYLTDSPTRQIEFDNGNILISLPDGSYLMRVGRGLVGKDYTVPINHPRYNQYNDYFNEVFDLGDIEYNDRGLMDESLDNPDGAKLQNVTVTAPSTHSVRRKKYFVPSMDYKNFK